MYDDGHGGDDDDDGGAYGQMETPIIPLFDLSTWPHCQCMSSPLVSKWVPGRMKTIEMTSLPIVVITNYSIVYKSLLFMLLSFIA